MIDEVFLTLVSAWRVSMLASMLLFTALAVAPYWDSTVYFTALREALTSEPF